MGKTVIASSSLTDTRWLRLTSFTALYFAQGIPIGLFTIALPAWLAEHGMGVAQIATFQGIVSLPWGFKLIAGPFMDRFSFLAMGRRRPWVMGAQAGLAVSLATLAVVPDAISHFSWLIAAGFAANSFAAVQDVGVDGMAIDVLPVEERGRANALMAFGQVAGFSSFAALSGVLLNFGGLSVAALVAAVTVIAILVLVTLSRERPGERLLPWTAGRVAARVDAPAQTFQEVTVGLVKVVFLPMSLLLAFVECVNRMRDGIAVSVVPVFAVQELGFSSVEYSSFQGYTGFAIALIGVLFGPLIDRFGAKRLMMIALGVSALSSFVIGSTPMWWGDTAYIVGVAIVMGLAGQMIFVAYIALAMNLCWPRVAATQFAIYMSLSNLSRSVGAGAYASVADRLDYADAFLMIGTLMVLALVALKYLSMDAHQARLDKL